MANYKKFIAILLIFSVSFNSFANTALGGWGITDRVRQGASTLINASKTAVINGANVLKTSHAKITPSVAQVSKAIVRTGAVIAVDIAIKSILGAVDYVMDPANNRVIYHDVDPTSIPYQPDAFCASYQQETVCSKSHTTAAMLYVELYKNLVNKDITDPNARKVQSTTVSDQKDPVQIGGKFISTFIMHITYTNGQTAIQNVSVRADVLPSEDEEEERYLSYDRVATEIIEQADSGNDISIPYVGAVADEALQSDPATQANARQQLDANAKTETSEAGGGTTKPVDPANPDAGNEFSLNFPVFCTWAPTICEAAQVVVDFPTTVTEWWTTTSSWLDWVKEKYDASVTSISEFFSQETNTDTELEFNDPTDDITDTTISFSDQCPAPITLADFNYHGIQQKWEMDFTGWCDVLTTYFKPIVIAMAGFSAVLIVSGVRENV